MDRTHDVGGRTGFGPVAREADEPPFHAEWEARVFALNRILMGRGHYDLDQFRAAVETLEPQAGRTMSYYERWLAAIEALLARRELLETP